MPFEGSLAPILSGERGTFLGDDVTVAQVLLPFGTEGLQVVVRVDIFEFIDNFLHEEGLTIFSFRIFLDSTRLSLAFSSKKVCLFEGTVLGITLIVFFMGSV